MGIHMVQGNMSAEDAQELRNKALYGTNNKKQSPAITNRLNSSFRGW